MVDAVIQRVEVGARPRQRSSLRKHMQRKSTVAFFMALPLILLIALLVIYPAFTRCIWPRSTSRCSASSA